MRVEANHTAVLQTIANETRLLSDRISHWHELMNKLTRDYGQWEFRLNELDKIIHTLEGRVSANESAAKNNWRWVATIVAVVGAVGAILGSIIERWK